MGLVCQVSVRRECLQVTLKCVVSWPHRRDESESNTSLADSCVPACVSVSTAARVPYANLPSLGALLGGLSSFVSCCYLLLSFV